jgi:adenine phosphoribosyltransferase
VEYIEKMIQNLERIVRDALPIYKDWPKEGVNYLNTVDICKNAEAFRASVDWYYRVATDYDVDYVFAADARGFIWGSVLAYRLGIPLYVIRKKGKMPGELVSRDYELEYGIDTLQMQKLSLTNGTCIIVDDVLATGGTAEALCDLVYTTGIPYTSMVLASLIDITFLPGRKKITDKRVAVETLIDVR